jgi:AAA ATPase domain/Periplasmic binding protein-like domain
MNARVSSAVMVGRDEQLAAVEQAFDLAREGSPGIVLLAGEAGAGKTRLIAEFAGRCAAEAAVLSGGCVDLGGSSVAFAPFTAALRGLTRQIGADGVAALLPGGVPGQLARLLPGVHWPGPGARPDSDGVGDGAGADGAARARLFEEVLGLLENLADQRPAVLIIEDAHWADRSSRDLLWFLARNLQPGTRLLAVVSYRIDDLSRGHPLLAELDRLPLVRRVELSRLSRREVIAQVRGILGRPGAAGLVTEVARRSDGNPLFGPASSTARNDRYRGAARVLRRAGITITARSQHTSPSTAMDGERLAQELRRSGAQPDVIIAYSDAVALGVLHALRDSGINAGADIGVASFDDVPDARYQSPPLTSVATFPADIGAQAARLLLARIDDPQRPCESAIIAPQLKVRESTTSFDPNGQRQIAAVKETS